MSCYEGSTAELIIELEEWHDLISQWDALDGRSPVMQICRLINSIQNTLYQPLYPFLRVGTFPEDTAPVGTPYELNPTWHPVNDLQQTLISLLISLRATVRYFSNPELRGFNLSGVYVRSGHVAFIDPSDCPDCTYRYFEDAEAILASVDTSIHGASNGLPNIWYEYIRIARELIEALNGQTYILQEWPIAYTISDTKYLYSTTQYADHGLNDPAAVMPEYYMLCDEFDEFGECITAHCEHPASPSNYSDYRYQILAPTPPPSRDPGDPTEGVGVNYYADAEHTCGHDSVSTTPYGLPFFNIYVGINFERDSSMEWIDACAPSGQVAMSDAPLEYDSGTPYCDQNISWKGWTRVNQVVFTYRIQRHTDSEGLIHDLTDGEGFTWSAVTVGDSEVVASVSPSSGTYYWAPGQTYQDLIVTLDLVSATQRTDVWGPVGRTVSLTLETIRQVCADACGNLHLQPE